MISIQVLRGFAALLVVLVHSTLKAQSLGMEARVFEIGHSGVDLFFIISGFIMMMIGARENNFYLFMSKRIIRVIPLYYIITTMALLVYIYNPSLIKGNNGVISIINSYLLIPAQGKSFLLSVGWTLSYEMFFYLVFASVVFIKSSLKGIVASLILVILLVVGRNSDNYVAHSFFSPIILEFSIGIFCFYVYNFLQTKISNKKKYTISALLLIVGISCFAVQKDPLFTIFENRVIDLAIPMMFVFLSFIFSEAFFKKNKMRNIIKMFTYIGDSSYSIYLTHLFSLAILAKIFTRLEINNPFVFLLSCLIASVAGGFICYELIEKNTLKTLGKTIFYRSKHSPKLDN